MKVLVKLFEEIPQDEHGVQDNQGRDTLQYTGQLWESCDFMINLADQGLKALAAAKVTEYRDLVDDALGELEGWTTGEVDDGDDSSSTVFLPLPQVDDTMKALSKNVLKKLRLVGLLYPPLLKRRIKRFPEINGSTSPEQLPSSKQVADLDMLMAYTQLFQEETDNIAETLYTSNMEEEVKVRLGIIIDYAKKALAVVGKNWDGRDDEFTAWSDKWLIRINEP